MDALASIGLDTASLCAYVGITPAMSAQNGDGCSGDLLNDLWELAEKRSANPAIALCGGQMARPALFGIVSYAMMTSPNLLGALDRLIRYIRMVSELAILDLIQQGDRYLLRLELFSGHRAVSRHRFEFDCLVLVTFFRWIVGGAADSRPVFWSIEFAHPSPIDKRPYEQAFDCPVKFGANFNGVVFNAQDLLLPLPTANTLLIDIHDRFAEQELSLRSNKHMTSKVRDLIIRGLPDGEPKRKSIASTLCMTERTLGRRLHNEGTSFQDILNDTRRKLTQQYLRQPNITLAEVAYLLGFMDHSTFIRACKRWFHLPPGQLREQILAEKMRSAPKRYGS